MLIIMFQIGSNFIVLFCPTSTETAEATRANVNVQKLIYCLKTIKLHIVT